jgi:ubiquitin-conjugating enzyme E2 J1
MPRTLAAIVSAQLKKIIKSDEEYYTAMVDPQDIQTVYVLVGNLPDDYKGGQYLYKLTIPSEFPDKPPHLYALTPNGVFETGGQICVSIGTFHQNDHRNSGSKGAYGWRPAIGLGGFILNGVVNAMLHFDSKDHGIRINIETPEVKKSLAKISTEYNKTRLGHIQKLFDDLKDSCSKLKIWDHS